MRRTNETLVSLALSLTSSAILRTYNFSGIYAVRMTGLPYVFSHRTIVANISRSAIGFVIWSFMPDANASSRSPVMALAVIAMIGSARNRPSARIARVAA